MLCRGSMTSSAAVMSLLRLKRSQRSLNLLLTAFPRASSGGGASDKKPLRKPSTPQGRLDRPDEKSTDVLEKFPDDVNPITREKGGPRGPEPTRYGDWERKGRCVDF